MMWLSPDYTEELANRDRELWAPTPVEQLDALEVLIRGDVPQPLRRACIERYLELTERKAIA